MISFLRLKPMKHETRCVKIKLKPNSIEKVRTWAKTINERKDEALATLRDEGVVLETVFLDRTTEGDFLICLMRAENFERAKKAVQKSVHAIDEYHQNFKKECWMDDKKLEMLIDLDRFSEIK
jgi:arabinogalactan endo-1,4-beta-galactosidase